LLQVSACCLFIYTLAYIHFYPSFLQKILHNFSIYFSSLLRAYYIRGEEDKQRPEAK
jgi:hypothetical protein